MDPNIFTIRIPESVTVQSIESLWSILIPVLSGLVGAILGALSSWLSIRWQMKKSYNQDLEIRAEEEKNELQNLYRTIKVGVEGYLKFMSTTIDNIKSADNQKPAFFFTNQTSHCLPGYKETINQIMKIPDSTLLEAVMATNHNICDFGGSIQEHNDLFRQYNRSIWRARRTNDEIDVSEANNLLQFLSITTDSIKAKFETVENNITNLMKLLEQKLQDQIN